MTRDRQRALASNPTLIKDYFQKLDKGLTKYASKPENMYNMDGKGFLIGYNNRAKILCDIGDVCLRKHKMDPENGLQLWNVHRQTGLCYHQ